MTLRVLHAPDIVAGHAGALAAVEREIGLQSRCISFSRHRFGYECDEVLPDIPGAPLANNLKRLRVLWRALREFDVVHFNFGTTLLPRAQRNDSSGRPAGLGKRLYHACLALLELKDLPLLKKAGKAIFVTYQGDDARQGAYSREHFRVCAANEVGPEYYSAQSDAGKQRDIRTFDRYADGIFALNPDLLHVLPARARFLPYTHVDPRKWLPLYPAAAVSRPLVVHAPSHRAAKGTRFVLDAVTRLRAEGVAFDFVLVEDMTHEEARRIYEKADLLIDQLLAGWYGGLAVETMALGKPVLCYLRDEDLRFLDPGMRAELPIIRAEPATIYEILKTTLTSGRDRLAALGRQSRAYVERWHDPHAIARFLSGEYLSALRSRA